MAHAKLTATDVTGRNRKRAKPRPRTTVYRREEAPLQSEDEAAFDDAFKRLEEQALINEHRDLLKQLRARLVYLHEERAEWAHTLRGLDKTERELLKNFDRIEDFLTRSRARSAFQLQRDLVAAAREVKCKYLEIPLTDLINHRDVHQVWYGRLHAKNVRELLVQHGLGTGMKGRPRKTRKPWTDELA